MLKNQDIYIYYRNLNKIIKRNYYFLFFISETLYRFNKNVIFIK